MPADVKVLYVEPPAERRVGGIETCLQGLERFLPSTKVEIARTDKPVPEQLRNAAVVHFHGIWEPTHHRARNYCVQSGKPFLVSPHGMLEAWALRHRGWKKLPYFHLVERRSIGRSHALLATSASEAATLARWFPKERLRVLPLGIEPVEVPPHDVARRRLGLPPDEFVVLFLSRCHPKKGLHLLIEALEKLSSGSQGKIRLLVVGDGDLDYTTPLRERTGRWAGGLRCTWVGACWGPQKWEYFSAADLMCLPSFSENFGLAVLESLIAGTPVVTTTATPWVELRENLPITFCEPRVAELAAALSASLEAGSINPALRQATQAGAIDRFGWDRLAPRYAALYRELAAPG